MSLSNIVKKHWGKLILVSAIIGYTGFQKISYDNQLKYLEQLKSQQGTFSALHEAREVIMNTEANRPKYYINLGKNFASNKFIDHYSGTK